MKLSASSIFFLCTTLCLSAAPKQRLNPQDHWAFKPITVAPGQHSIDSFITAKLGENGLAMSPAADPVTWLRRVTMDLTGLPPAPEEVARLGSESPEQTVDRLLASPRYGERWAQHWLDVVRYADTHGFEVNTERPNAWPYRDYVIRAFNDDTPYDRFIKEQIAGDALGADAATGFLVTASVLLPGQIGKDAPSILLARQDALDEMVNNVGQTFLGLSIGCARCHDHKFDPITAKDYYSMQAFVAGVEYEDRPMRTPEAEVWKKEAVPLRTRLLEIDRRLADFAPYAHPRNTPPGISGARLHPETSAPLEVKPSGTLSPPEGVPPPPLRPTVNSRANTDRFSPVKTTQVRFTILSTNSLEPCLDEVEVYNTAGENIATASRGTQTITSGDNTVVDRHERRFINDGSYGNSRSWMSDEPGKGWIILTFARREEISRVVWGRDREGIFEDRLPIEYRIETARADGSWQLVADSTDRRPWIAGMDPGPVFTTAGLAPDEAAAATRLLEEKESVAGKIKLAETGQLAFAGKFRAPDRIQILNRGDPGQPRADVTPAIPSVFGDLKLPGETPEQMRRLGLADWIASPQNPLTARVMVNRIWLGHFGSGLVQTASDFGINGLKPTHPELLDWLAQEFIRSGWSVKHLHRLIVLSAAYRQASTIYPAASARDADARWLWRFPSRRLEAESIRDAMLQVSGQLDLKMYGRGFDLFDQRGGLNGFKPVESFTGAGLRRMIYAHKVRRETEAVFGAFDCPDAGQSTANRRESTTPIQALNLFNSRFTLDAATALASRVSREVGDGVEAQIRRVYQLALGREPGRDESAAAGPVVQQHGLATLCRAVFNSNEFLFTFTGVVGTGGDAGSPGGVVVVEAISKLFSGETPETGALGTFRGSRGAGQAGTKAPDVWAIDVSQSETQCVPGGMVPTLWRSQASRELTIAVEYLTSKTGALVQFPAGVDVVAWPAQVPLEDGGRYSIRDSNDTWRSGLTLRVIPVEQTSTIGRAAWMAENGCAAQARTLMANL